MFLHSPGSVGQEALGITVIYSIFHRSGQVEDSVIRLKMWVTGTANLSGYKLYRAAGISPGTVDEVFFDFFMLWITSATVNCGKWRSKVLGIWSSVNGWYCELRLLKKPASLSETSLGVSPGYI